jgi:hypothetical protein
VAPMTGHRVTTILLDHRGVTIRHRARETTKSRNQGS